MLSREKNFRFNPQKRHFQHSCDSKSVCEVTPLNNFPGSVPDLINNSARVLLILYNIVYIDSYSNGI